MTSQPISIWPQKCCLFFLHYQQNTSVSPWLLLEPQYLLSSSAFPQTKTHFKWQLSLFPIIFSAFWVICRGCIAEISKKHLVLLSLTASFETSPFKLWGCFKCLLIVAGFPHRVQLSPGGERAFSIPVQELRKEPGHPQGWRGASLVAGSHSCVFQGVCIPTLQWFH